VHKNNIIEGNTLDEVRQFLTAYGEGHAWTLSLASSCGLLVCQLVAHYVKHLENKEAEVIVNDWGPESAERVAWNFTNWVNAMRFDGPLNASDL